MVSAAQPKPTEFDAADALRLPPYSEEAEQSVLGGLMLDNSTWDHIADIIREEDFYRQDHRLVFRAINELADRNDPFDVHNRAHEAVADGIAAGHQARPCRRAHWTDIEAVQLDTLAGESVDVGSLDLLAVERDVRPAEVIGDDDDNVRLLGGEEHRPCRQQKPHRPIEDGDQYPDSLRRIAVWLH